MSPAAQRRCHQQGGLADPAIGVDSRFRGNDCILISERNPHVAGGGVPGAEIIESEEGEHVQQGGLAGPVTALSPNLGKCGNLPHFSPI